jgi:hypothetical protein
VNEVGITKHARLAVLTGVAGAAAVILAVTGITSGELTAADRETTPTETSESFSYFPAQYVNRATEASEHIQAF